MNAQIAGRPFELIPKALMVSVKGYSKDKLRPDLFAGLSVALVALPQGIAYALLAGLNPTHGLYAAMVGAFLASLFGSSRLMITGPVNAIAILTATAMISYHGHPNFVGLIFLLTLLVGLFQLAAGFMRLGNLAQFISRSVLEGFIAAAALQIAVFQLPNLLGIPGHGTPSILSGFRQVFAGLPAFRSDALALGLGTIALILILNRISPKSSTGVPLLPSYLLGLLGAAGTVLLFGLHKKGVFVVGEIPGTLPPFTLPAFGPGLIKSLAPPALAIALIGLAQAITIGKSIAAHSYDRIDPDREFLGQGIANVGACFLGGMPVSGSLVRSAMNARAGAATRFAGILSGIFLAIIVFALGRMVRYVPVAAVAGILILICINMVNWLHARIALRATRSDALAMLGTFAGALIYPLDKAVFIGVGISLILFLRRVQAPRFSELIYDENAGFQELNESKERPVPEISIVHIEGDVFFGAADALQEQISRIANREELEVLILRMKRACCLDATGILGLMKLHENMVIRGKLLLVSGATGEVETVFRRSGLDRVIGLENIFFSDETILRSTREAVQRALDYVNQKCGKQYRVRLFFDRPDASMEALHPRRS